MLKQFLLVFFISFLITDIYAQTIENWISSNEKIPAEKIYLQTDAEDYFIGDTVWFNVYLVDSRSGRLIPEQKMYMLVF